MVTPEQGTVAALNLAGQAAELLEAIGDNAGSLRLRHTVAIIRNDASYPTPEGFNVPLSLMRMALALVDRDGHRLSNIALHLQMAIDCARGSKPLKEGEEIDPDLLASGLFELPNGGPVRGWSKTYAKPGGRPDWDGISGLWK